MDLSRHDDDESVVCRRRIHNNGISHTKISSSIKEVAESMMAYATPKTSKETDDSVLTSDSNNIELTTSEDNLSRLTVDWYSDQTSLSSSHCRNIDAVHEAPPVRRVTSTVSKPSYATGDVGLAHHLRRVTSFPVSHDQYALSRGPQQPAPAVGGDDNSIEPQRIVKCRRKNTSPVAQHYAMKPPLFQALSPPKPECTKTPLSFDDSDSSDNDERQSSCTDESLTTTSQISFPGAVFHRTLSTPEILPPDHHSKHHRDHDNDNCSAETGQELSLMDYEKKVTRGLRKSAYNISNNSIYATNSVLSSSQNSNSNNRRRVRPRGFNPNNHSSTTLTTTGGEICSVDRILNQATAPLSSPLDRRDDGSRRDGPGAHWVVYNDKDDGSASQLSTPTPRYQSQRTMATGISAVTYDDINAEDIPVGVVCTDHYSIAEVAKTMKDSTENNQQHEVECGLCCGWVSIRSSRGCFLLIVIMAGALAVVLLLYKDTNGLSTAAAGHQTSSYPPGADIVRTRPSESPSLPPTDWPSPSPSTNPTASPTFNPTRQPTTYEDARNATITNTIVMISGAKEVSTPMTSQNRALKWVMEDDPLRLSHAEMTRVVSRYVLMVMYYGLIGDKWSRKDGYESGLHECEWEGITCNKKEEIVGIDIGNNQATGHLPAEISQLAELDTLVLRQNRIYGNIPPSIGDLKQLKYLTLQDNRLTGTLPKSFANLTKLERLYLQSNYLSGALPDNWPDAMKNLEHLWVNDNELGGSLPHTIGSFRKLEYFVLSRNNLKSVLPSDIGSLLNLKLLALDDNCLTGTIPSAIGSLVNLKTLHLSQNAFTGTIPDTITSLSQITQLLLGDNRLTGTTPFVLRNLHMLERLEIHGNSLTGPIPEGLSYLGNLKAVSLYSNRVTGTIPSRIGQLSRLIELRLYNNSLTGSIPEEVGSLTNLNVVELHFNDLLGTVPYGMCDVPKESFWADCGGAFPKVQCTCCNHCCSAWMCD